VALVGFGLTENKKFGGGLASPPRWSRSGNLFQVGDGFFPGKVVVNHYPADFLF